MNELREGGWILPTNGIQYSKIQATNLLSSTTPMALFEQIRGIR